MGAGDRTGERSEAAATEAMRAHGAVVARVCMALLGDAAATERALERIARDAATATFDDGNSALVRLLALTRVACATQLSKVPVRTTAARGHGAAPPPPTTTDEAAREPALARAALGKLRPTEREAVVLHLVGGLDAAQIAEACGIDLDTARQRIARGVGLLVQQEKKR